MTNDKAKKLTNAVEWARLAIGAAGPTARLCRRLAAEEKNEEYLKREGYYKTLGASMMAEAESLARQITGEDLKSADGLQKKQFRELMNLLQIEIE